MAEDPSGATVCTTQWNKIQLVILLFYVGTGPTDLTGVETCLLLNEIQCTNPFILSRVALSYYNLEYQIEGLVGHGMMYVIV